MQPRTTELNTWTSEKKCRKLVETVDVCEAVLRQYPDYPRIRDEILTKALACIRSSNNPA